MISDASEDSIDPTYDRPRGSCPRCGSEEVRHLVIGLPAETGASDLTPAWVDWVGCVHPGYDRACDVCRFTWTAGDPGEQVPTT